MGKFFTKISEAKTKTKSVVVKPLSVSLDSVKLKNKPLSVTPPTKINIVPKKRPKKEIISLPNPRPGSVGAHTLNLVTNQRVDFKPKKDVRYTIGKLRKKNMMGETQYGISFTKKF
tara:strand:- start:7120 stop:7467 length:348 start_codon:yes stop_codon:yes gene_type:complete